MTSNPERAAAQRDLLRISESAKDERTPRLAHCTPSAFSGHSPLCDRDGEFCSESSSHSGPCKPHGSPRPRIVEDEIVDFDDAFGL